MFTTWNGVFNVRYVTGSKSDAAIKLIFIGIKIELCNLAEYVTSNLNIASGSSLRLTVHSKVVFVVYKVNNGIV